MARIIDAETRLIDIDFGPVRVSLGRISPDLQPTTSSFALNGVNQFIRQDNAGGTGIAGSFCQYQLIDLDFMARNNDVMVPVSVDVQRTTAVPLGFNNNGNTFDTIEEFIFILTRPLNNTNINIQNLLSQFRDMGLDRSAGSQSLSGDSAGYPTQTQTIYAEKRSYSYSSTNAASIVNGELTQLPSATPPGTNPGYIDLNGMPLLQDVTTWGSLSSIVGPGLHCYRVVINRTQTFPGIGGLFEKELVDGASELVFPPVSVRFLCKDPKFTEGEYLTRIANAMNSTPEGGPTA